MITPESIETLKNHLDIVDVVGSYIELQKKGANYKAPCPFHDEKTPSFVVSEQKQLYKCFGCGAGGDSIKFVMEYEKLSYPEALEKLASDNNVTLQYTTAQTAKINTDVLTKLNNYYEKLLLTNRTALSYLHERGVYESTIEKFKIGYAPASKQTISFLSSNLFSTTDALKLGILGSDGSHNFARFIERITFPISSHSGSIIGWGGRTISNHPAKYVNSPQSVIFNKSKLLYAYHHAKSSIYKNQSIIITEGYLDVVMLHQAGFDNAVATLGTALTPEHIPLLRRGNPKVLMAYDGDSAGLNAALKASKLLSSSGFSGGVIIFANGIDPADMVKSGKSNELKELFLNPVEFEDFVIDAIISGYNLADHHQKDEAFNESVAYLKTLSSSAQEKYQRVVNAKLNKNVSLTKNVQKIALHVDEKRYDTWEYSLLKTMIEHPKFIDIIIEYISADMLKFHSMDFTNILNKNFDDINVARVVFDENIATFNDEKILLDEIRIFLKKYYKDELKKVFLLKEDFERKSFIIRKIKGKIDLLNRGHLVEK
ncbi:MAG: DNA primase [Campylobacterota bacterium]|nr:DNA primase [Campylobacterota bacterium]